MTIAESIERHLRLANAAVEWLKARDEVTQLVAGGAPGRMVDAARRQLERRDKQLASVVTELQR